MEDVILIRATAKRNGLTSMLVGAVGLLFASALLYILPSHFYLIGIFLCSAALVAMLIGWFKIREPAYSFELSKEQIHYYHRYGRWQLGWDNIQRVDTPKLQAGLEQRTLSMIGIRLKDYEPLLDAISLRLASNMLLEQRPLLLQGNNSDCASGNCYSENLIEEDRYQSANGRQYTGIKAMFANRMEKLRAGLGYDLYINAAELDRSAEDFVALLRSCQSEVQSQR